MKFLIVVAVCFTVFAVEAKAAVLNNEQECEENCKEEGDCQSYRLCDGGHWANQACDAETWWNTDASPFGGACDFWDNLSDDQQSKYRDDPLCPAPPLPCYWREDENCDNKYYWLDEGHKTNKSEVHLTCPTSGGVSLVWNQANKGCTHCNPAGSCTIC